MSRRIPSRYLPRHAMLLGAANGVSVRSLASAARVNLSMISYHFGGKEGLYAEILKEQFEGFRYIDDIAKRDLPPLEKCEMYIRGTIRRYRENPYLLRYYVTELTNPTPCFKTRRPACKGSQGPPGNVRKRDLPERSENISPRRHAPLAGIQLLF